MTATGSHPTTVPATSSTLLLTYSAQTGYNLPSSVVVSGAVSTWNKDSGKLTLYNIDGDISITITGERITYPITENLTNVTKVGTHPTFIAYGATIALQYATASGYEFPTSVTITGADSDWKPVSGTLTITNPTGPVTITIAGVLSTATVTYNLTHCTAASTNPATVTIGGSADLKFVADTGYELSATPTVTGATLASWDYPVADDKTTMVAGIENVTGNVTITVVASQPKLAAPTNLAVSGDTLTFDSVENAEQYEVFAGSTSLGTYEPVYTLEAGTYKWQDNPNVNSVSIEDMTLHFMSNNGENYSSIYINGTDGPNEIWYFDQEPLSVYFDNAWDSSGNFQTITLSTAQTVSADFYNWAITGGNLVKQP